LSARFAGKTVLVTGASTGIGLGIATGFAEAGANVALAARSADRLEAAAAALRARGLIAQAFPVDVASAASVQTLCKEVAERFGGLDILCANAGIYPVTRLEDITEAEWDQVLACKQHCPICAPAAPDAWC